jgi:hypothetical protein
MTDRCATALGTEPVPAAKLEPDAIGVAQDTVIGMASSAPAASVGLTLAALAAATAYGSGPVLVLTAVPMLVIANAYRRCNLWNANCGASFEWVGRAINPYLGRWARPGFWPGSSASRSWPHRPRRTGPWPASWSPGWP